MTVVFFYDTFKPRLDIKGWWRAYGLPTDGYSNHNA